MTIASDGKVGIGIAPTSALHLGGTGNKNVQVESSTANAASSIELKGGTGNRLALIDMTGDDTYTDYGLRIVRNNGGANTTSQILHRGTGSLDIYAQDAGSIQFLTSSAVRSYINSTGNFVVASPTSGTSLITTSSLSANASLSVESTHATYTGQSQSILVSRAATSAYAFLYAYSSGGGDLEFNIRGDGNAFCDGSWSGGGADYAEYFEWADGNPNNEDRRGYSVSLVNNKIKIAETGETVIGVISGKSSVIGDGDIGRWKGKYLTDDFGSYILDENGYRILNPEFNPNATYVSRENRPEWAVVGLMGKLRIRKNQIKSSNWIKMRDVSETVEEYLVK
jgi:hypothetical protein